MKFFKKILNYLLDREENTVTTIDDDRQLVKAVGAAYVEDVIYKGEEKVGLHFSLQVDCIAIFNSEEGLTKEYVLEVARETAKKHQEISAAFVNTRSQVPVV